RSPERAPPAAPWRGFKNLIGDKGDALRNLFLAQRKQRGLGQVQPVQLFAADLAAGQMAFHLPPLRVGQCVQEVVFQIEWRTIHHTPRAFAGANSALSSSSAAYRRDLMVETGQARISAISSNLKPW